KPIDRNRDALGLHQTGESAKKRGLPSAARAHQSNALAPMQLQGDVVQRWPEAPSPGVEEAQALDLDFLPAFRHRRDIEWARWGGEDWIDVGDLGLLPNQVLPVHGH